MARKVKETSAEDRLAAALVPAEEWPYQVPGNWVWTTVASLSLIVSKGTTPQGGKNAYKDGGIGFLRVENIADDGSVNHYGIKYISNEAHTGFLKRSILCEHDVLISIAGTLGKTAIVRGFDLPLNTNQAICFIRLIKYSANPIFVKYSLDNPVMQRFLLSKTKVTAIPNLTLEIISNCPLPFPPLPEQHRIVERIESLFAKLDEAKDEAQACIDGYEDRKAAILHKAFTGELTEKWRLNRGINISEWKKVTSTQLFEYVTSGSRGWAQYYSDDGPIFLRMGNLDHGTIELDLSDIQHVKLPDKAEGQRSLVQGGDILISITADVGMIGLVRESNYEAYINQHIALARPTEKDSAEFIAWYLVSDVGLSQFRQKQRGATKIGLGLNDIRELTLKMPSKEEQHEIVRRLDILLSHETEIKSAAEETLASIAALKQSILARAFRGELGTNDITDEPAIELLKRTLEGS